VEAWDRLAVRLRRPYCAPAWMLSWWRHAAPEGAELRSVLAFDGGELVGVAPFYCARRLGVTEYELLGAAAAGGIEPLAEEGARDECASLVSRALAHATPRPGLVRLRQAPRGSSWPGLLRAAWPGRRPLLLRADTTAAPFIERDSQRFEEYFGARSANFRAEFRRHRRGLERHGLSQRVSMHGPELLRDLRSFAKLHYGRWEARGGTGALRPELERALEAAAQELGEAERMRLYCLDVAGETVSVQVFFAAGGEMAYWLGGFDERWGSFGPGNLAVLAAVEDFFRRGEARLDLGPGAQRYKYRFATGERMLDSMLLAPPGPRLPVVVGVHLARRVKRGVSKRLSRGGDDSVEVARAKLLVDRQPDDRSPPGVR
jgi:CelD/BcsL family acetyltransferase involved in cellulose biosynthesis